MYRKEVIFKLYCHRINCDGSATDRLAPFWQTGYQALLPETDRWLFYTCVRHVCRMYTKQVLRHDFAAAIGQYGMSKREYLEQYMMDRVILFYRLLPEFPNWEIERMNKIQFHYKKNFSQYEAILQMERIGIALPDLPLLKLSGCREVHAFVAYFAWKRSGLQWRQWYEKRYGKEPSFYMESKFEATNAHIEALVSRSCLGEHRIPGFRGLSLTDIDNPLEIDEAESLW